MRIPELVLSGPDSIVASIPFVVGFHPDDSLVVMWLRDGCVRLTMRIDLPPDDVVPPGWVESVIAHRGTSDEAIACIVNPSGQPARAASGDLQGESLMSSLLARLGQTPCRVRDALLVVGDRWWSYLCAEPECCSPSGTPVDAHIADEVAARFVLAGVARLPDRAAVVATCDPDPSRRAAMTHLLTQARPAVAAGLAESGDPARALESWRSSSITMISAGLLGAVEPAADLDAVTLIGLGDVRVRDTVLWEIAHSSDHDPHLALGRALALVRAAPLGSIAPIGTVAAVLAWLVGDGVRAGAALDRVAGEDPDYALADLLRRSIQSGLSPASWLEMMHSLPREDCRVGRLLARPAGPS